MHLNTQQHGAYLLLLFHLWRRGTLPDDDTALAKITGLTPKEWTSVRQVLEPYFTVNNGLWQHSRVERERVRIAARQEKRGIRAKSAAVARWDKHAPSMTQALLVDAIPNHEPRQRAHGAPGADHHRQQRQRRNGNRGSFRWSSHAGDARVCRKWLLVQPDSNSIRRGERRSCRRRRRHGQQRGEALRRCIGSTHNISIWRAAFT